MKRLDLVGLHVEASSGISLVVVREHDPPHRVLPIAVGGAEAASIAVALGGQPPPRPLAHDLMAALVESLGARVDRVEVTELRAGAFLAELAVVGPRGLRRLDARPSDGIALALRVGAPLYVSETVLEEAGSYLPEAPEDEEIDRAVDEFRGRLDELDAAALAAALGQPQEGPATGPPGEPDDAPAPDADPGTDDPR